MTTTSYPAVGVGGFTPGNWSTSYASQDGIIEDYGGNACAVELINSSDTVRVHAGRLQVNGYTLEIGLDTNSPGYEDLYCAPVVAGKPNVTYYVGAIYDPALNVAQGSADPNPGQRSDQGPCRLGIWTSLDLTGGKGYAPLYTLVRPPSTLLSSCVVTDFRRWTGPVFVGNTDNARLYPAGFGSMPRGSIWIQTTDPTAPGGALWVRDLVPGDSLLSWRPLLQSRRIALPILSDKKAQNTPPTYFRCSGDMIGFDGTVTRANGNVLISPSNVFVTLAVMPATASPNSLRRFQCSAGFASMSQLDSVTVTVDTTGYVQILPPPTYKGDVLWVDLSNVNYRAGA